MLKGSKRDIIGIIILILVAALGLIAFKLISSGALDGLRSNFSSDWQDLRTQSQIVQDNTRDLIAPPRKPHSATLLAQERLKQAWPQLFDKFTDGDWRYVWDVIYGLHETNDYGTGYKPARKRQLTIEEIQETLSYDYPAAFGRFDGQLWVEFWKLISKR